MRHVNLAEAKAHLSALVERAAFDPWHPLTWTQVGWPEGVATDVELSFEPAGEGTLVRLEQTGFERLGPDVTSAFPSALKAACDLSENSSRAR